MQDPKAKIPEDSLNVFGRIRERIRRRRESPIDMPEVEDQAAPEPAPEKPPKTQAPRSEFEPAPAPALEFPTQRTTRWGGRGNYFYDYTPPSGNTPARIRLHGGPNNNKSGLTITEASHPEAFRAILDEYNTMSQKGNVQPYVSLQEYRQQAPRNNQTVEIVQAVDSLRGRPGADFEFLESADSVSRPVELLESARSVSRPVEFLESADSVSSPAPPAIFRVRSGEAINVIQAYEQGSPNAQRMFDALSAEDKQRVVRYFDITV